MAALNPNQQAYESVMAALSDEERGRVESLSDDGSYVTPRVISHLTETQHGHVNK